MPRARECESQTLITGGAGAANACCQRESHTRSTPYGCWVCNVRLYTTTCFAEFYWHWLLNWVFYFVFIDFVCVYVILCPFDWLFLRLSKVNASVNSSHNWLRIYLTDDYIAQCQMSTVMGSYYIVVPLPLRSGQPWKSMHRQAPMTERYYRRTNTFETSEGRTTDTNVAPICMMPIPAG